MSLALCVMITICMVSVAGLVVLISTFDTDKDSSVYKWVDKHTRPKDKEKL